MLIRFQLLKADTLNQRKGPHFSTQLVVWPNSLVQVVSMDLKMKLDILHLLSISISRIITIGAVVVLHNNLLKETQV